MIVYFVSLQFFLWVHDTGRDAIILRILEVMIILRIVGTLRIARRLKILIILMIVWKKLAELNIGVVCIRLELTLDIVGIAVTYERLIGMQSKSSEVDSDLVVGLAEKCRVLRAISPHLLTIILETVGEDLGSIWENLASLAIEDWVPSLRIKALIELICY